MEKAWEITVVNAGKSCTDFQFKEEMLHMLPLMLQTLGSDCVFSETALLVYDFLCLKHDMLVSLCWYRFGPVFTPLWSLLKFLF